MVFSSVDVQDHLHGHIHLSFAIAQCGRTQLETTLYGYVVSRSLNPYPE